MFNVYLLNNCIHLQTRIQNNIRLEQNVLYSDVDDNELPHLFWMNIRFIW